LQPDDMGERFIIHLNVADFAVAVERLTDPRFRTRPLVIASQGARAVVYDMSEEAFQDGVRKHMALSLALRRCRDACVVSPHFHRYETAMKELVRCALPYSPLIEMTDYNGHLFVDATGTGKLFGPAPDVAQRIRKEVRQRIGVDPIWAVAPNKLTAKVATRLVKPVGEYIIGAGDESAFLRPVALCLIPGIEPDDLNRFYAFNLTCAGQAGAWSLDQLDTVFAKRAPFIHDIVRGIDPSPVAAIGDKPPKISLDHEFAEDTNDPAVVEGWLYRLTEQAGADLRRQMLAVRRTGIMIGYSDGVRIIRQARVQPPTANNFFLFAAAKTALTHAWTRRVRIRNIRLIFDRLTYPPAQLSLFPDKKEKSAHNLISTMDAIRRRFGHSAISLGRTLAVSPP
jgi:DNA polymerase IV